MANQQEQHHLQPEIRAISKQIKPKEVTAPNKQQNKIYSTQFIAKIKIRKRRHNKQKNKCFIVYDYWYFQKSRNNKSYDEYSLKFVFYFIKFTFVIIFI